MGITPEEQEKLENTDGVSHQVERLVSCPQTLPRCQHGYALSDWSGEWLHPPCGCNFDNTNEYNKRKMAILKLGLGN